MTPDANAHGDALARAYDDALEDGGPTMEPGRWMVGWNPYGSAPSVQVGPWPDTLGGWSDRWPLTSGFTYRALGELPEAEQRASILALALEIVADGVPLAAVLREFWKTPEFRAVLPPATRPPDALRLRTT